MPVNERRAAIIAATEQLIVQRGGEVSTRAIAEAAGIAEGTIFRVFPSKDAIIEAIFEDAFDAESRRSELADIDPGADLKTRMRLVVEILERRARRVTALFNAIGFRQPKSMCKPDVEAARVQGYLDIERIFEQDRADLRLTPAETARLVRAMVMALTNPVLSEQPITDPDVVVDLILNGILKRPELPTSIESRPC